MLGSNTNLAWIVRKAIWTVLEMWESDMNYTRNVREWYELYPKCERVIWLYVISHHSVSSFQSPKLILGTRLELIGLVRISSWKYNYSIRRFFSMQTPHGTIDDRSDEWSFEDFRHELIGHYSGQWPLINSLQKTFITRVRWWGYLITDLGPLHSLTDFFWTTYLKIAAKGSTYTAPTSLLTAPVAAAVSLVYCQDFE